MTLIDRACWERGCACHDDRDKFDTVEVVQRTWVGLTLDEQADLYIEYSENPALFYRAIEDKLRSKNT